MALRVLVTGLSGFVGRHFEHAIQEHAPGAVVVPLGCDISDRDAVRARVAAAAPDVCLHLAAVATIRTAEADPQRAWAVNLHGTLALADALKQGAPSCPLVFVSSGEAYGRSFQAGLPLDETAPLAPMNTYSATKAAADLSLGAIADEQLHVIRLRPFNHTGPGQSAEYMVPAFARQVARIKAGAQEPVLRTGNLTSARDFLDVRDVVRCYALASTQARALPNGTILNVASGVPRQAGEILSRLLALAGVTAVVETDPARLRRNDVPIAVGNAALATRLLGWSPRVPLDTTLRDVLTEWQTRTDDP